MTEDRSRYALLVAALGAVLLGLSVFLPWYGAKITPAGVADVQQMTDSLVARFGNGSLQALAPSMRAGVGALAGHEVGSFTARQAISGMSTVLLVLAGLALLDALLPLARPGAVPAGGGRALLLLGLVACGCVIFRLLAPPTPAGEVLSLAPREGVWLALLGALMMVAGGAWPRPRIAAADPETGMDAALGRLSGWTPQS
jgi:hypothetical protein